MTNVRARFALRLALLLGLVPLCAIAATSTRVHPAKEGKSHAAKHAGDARQAGRANATGEEPAAAPAPMMPVTVVRPGSATAAPATPQPPAPAAETARPRAVSLGEHGVIELGQPNGGAPSRWKGFPISLSLRDAPLPEVLRSFARLAGMNLVLSPQVQGTVTVELHDVPWDQALYVILKSEGMGAEIDGRVWTVAPY
ncbi:MAG TPA: hypothetical protein VGV61_15410 [Thermoanaerobaculia bacterium]|nr:hypothetical protein [Thermoanaerobaculia bacterium]